MAKLVTKFKYIKPGSGKNVGNYAAYIAKRPGVEKIDDSMKYARATVKQKKMIERLLRDFPDSVELIEYEDYAKNGSVENASDFIKQAIDTHYDEIADMKVYANTDCLPTKVKSFSYQKYRRNSINTREKCGLQSYR